ncbi:pseudaminic acid cytidylyltransferase [Echinicola strongylocentroti]|uniref:Pseudaminic acid cytidylyltransferase n=2 Tax=Echinicola strongylocentroti TaxID=1795355 RepID=A0A2Z4IM85_9BACT|nr:pseudaminic acid cytidylyltransferase [Echinicola strongylocentroti]
MANLCIIPARGGSKRIPRKNIKDFLGKPIIAYSIETALSSNLFDEVMVSTDDDEIADIAIELGAKVPFFRSTKNADDYSTTLDVIKEVILAYKGIGKDFDNGCCIYPTAPLVDINDLELGYRKMLEEGRSSVFPLVAFSYPVWRGFENVDDGAVKMIWPEYKSSRSQDLKKVYHDAGQWYWFKINDLIKREQLFGDNTGGIELSELKVQDIDTQIDWKLAELKYEILQGIK